MFQGSPSTFTARLQQLRDACLPFVARTFRGERLRRHIAISGLLGVLSVLLGIWLSFGSGDFERDVRGSLDLEPSRWDADRIAFTITVDGLLEYERLADEQRRFEQEGVAAFSQFAEQRQHAYSTLYTALAGPVPHRFADLEARAAALLAAHPPDAGEPSTRHMGDAQFNWHLPDERARLRAIVERELVPQVVLYTSPLTAMDAVRLTGAVAGGLVVLLMLVVAPLSSGATVAQEVHENTLQPVLGTRLRPADVITGLAASGMALAGLLAAPSLAIMLVAGIAAGSSAAHLVLVLLLLPAASLMMVLLTALAGFGLGKRWSSGIVATLLTVGLLSLMLAGVGVGMSLEEEMAGFIAMMPPAGLFHGLREVFAPANRLGPVDAAHATAITALAVVGFSALALIIGRALTRRIEGRTQASLTRIEGLLGAGICLVLALAVLPDFQGSHAVPAYFVSLGLAAVPYMLIIAGRVPLGDGPAKLRIIPLRALMLEFLAYVGLHALVLTAIFGPGAIPWEAMGAFHLAWAVGVLGLLSVRLVALPSSILGSLFAVLVFASVSFEFFSAGLLATAVTEYGSHASDHPFLLFEASAVLGMLQLFLTVALPIVLVRTLRKGSAGLV